MNCSVCEKEIPAGAYFCVWCKNFASSKGIGNKANLLTRLIALLIDPLIAVVLYAAAIFLLSTISKDVAQIGAIFFPICYLIYCFIFLFPKGLTPGKKIMGLQVVNQHTGL